MLRPTTPREPKPSRFGLFRFRSPLLTESLICFLFLRVLRWFTSPGLLLPAYAFSRGSLNLPSEGLPHSEIPGSKPVCGSPRLIAACHVLHRFSAPRHPPSTLSSLTIKYLRRESFSFLPDSLVKDRDHRGSKSPSSLSVTRSFLIRAALESSIQPDNYVRSAQPDSETARTGARQLLLRTSIPKNLVELTGFEPATYGLQSRRSPS